MFWGLKLEGGSHYTQLVTKSFHISRATLAVGTVKNDQMFDSNLVTVHAIVKGTDYILCYLGGVHSNSERIPNTLVEQQPLDLEVSEGEEIILYASSKPASSKSRACTVYLTGYFNQGISSRP